MSKIGSGLITVFAAIALVSTAWYAFTYATEVPDGYQRISFDQLHSDNHSDSLFPADAESLNGKKVFLKGYVKSGAKLRDLKEFFLISEIEGGIPEITEVVAIRIVKEGTTVDYGLGLRRIGGVFKLNPRSRATRDKDVPQVFYEIEADYVR